MLVEFLCETGFAGCEHQEIVELPDDMTEKEIDEEFRDWLNNQIDCSWCILKKDDE